VKLCGALSQLEWRGFKTFALPVVIASAMRGLEVESLSTLRLLVVLFKMGMLNDVDEAWSAQLDQWVCRRFTDRSIGDEFVIELNSVSELSPILPSLSKLLVPIVDSTLSSEHPKEDSDASWMNAWVLGSCMQCLAQRSAHDGLPHVDVVSWTRRCTKNWSWSATVLQGLVGLVQMR
jgi:U3 small nucleolar RNA-associated protein 20